MPPQPDRRARVLVVDDDEPALYARSRVLERAGFEVLQARTGAEALALYDSERPDLVLLDVNLPDLGGMEVCARVKRDHPDAVVAEISAKLITEEDRVRGLDAGADAYFNASMSGAELVANVRALLRLRRAERASREQAAMLDAVMEHVPEGITIAFGPDVRIARVSAYGSRLLERPPGALQDIAADRHVDAYRIVDPRTGRPADPAELPLTRAARSGETVMNEEWLVESARGERIPVLCNAGPIRDADGAVIGGVIAWRDATALKKAEAELHGLVGQRDMLLQELNHRVKNSLQLITSMLGMQARRIGDAQTRGELETARKRILVVARLYEHIYKAAPANGQVDLAAMLRELCAMYDQAFAPAAAIACDVESVKVAPNRALPLMLLTNELVSNAYKHAFPDGRAGAICVGLRRRAPRAAELSVTDDGVGFDPQVVMENLGFRLIRQLAAQLDGEIAIASRAGTVATIAFPCAPAEAIAPVTAA